MLLSSMLIIVGCLEKGDETIMLNGGKNEIPSDDEADVAPEVVDPNIPIPNINPIFEYEGKNIVVRFDMNGILKPNSTNEYMYLRGTGAVDQNVWLDLDNKPKGFVVYNASDNQLGTRMKNDFVFLIDNSGSMDDEADAIARDIVAWAASLDAEMDIRFAIVGYDGRITGGIDFTDNETIAAYLNRSGKTGTSRTEGFAGDNASDLKNLTEQYNGSNAQECGMAALMFAHDNYAFRPGANRIYVNFTDEHNTVTGGEERFSVEYLKDAANWDPSYGTIHTVFSDLTQKDKDLEEKPWLMSEYTGGSVMFVDSGFEGVSLESLPVTGAMQHAYTFKFRHQTDAADTETHNVRITVYDDNGAIRAVKEFGIKFNIKL